MGENSKIEWCHATFNPWRGCTKVSAGCANCYAERNSKRNPDVLGVWGPQGTRVVAPEAMWKQPLRWEQDAREAGERRRVFCASISDVFEDWRGLMIDIFGNRLHAGEGWVEGDARSRYWYRESPCDETPGPWLTMQDVRIRLCRLIDATPNLDWLLLTKRPQNVSRMTYDAWCPLVPGHVSQNPGDGHRWNFPPNVWLGTSVEDQATADERIPHLLRIPAAKRFLSCEPLLGPVDFRKVPGFNLAGSAGVEMLRNFWVIVGGESGPNARPMHPDWARGLRDQCVEAEVPFFFKQGSQTAEWPKFKDFGAFPLEFQIRELPDAAR